MAIVVRPDVEPALRSEAGWSTMLQVVSGRDAAVVTAAVKAAVPDICALTPEDNPVVPMGPYLVPDGCVLLGDFPAGIVADIPARVPGILARHLEAAGITEAEIRLARVADRYDPVTSFAPAARAWLVGSMPQPGSGVFPALEPRFIEAGAGWIGGQLRPGAELTAVLVAMEVPVSLDGLRRVLDGRRDGPPGTPENRVCAVATDFTSFAAGVHFGDFLGTSVTLSVAGAGWTAAEITAQMRGQQEVVRSCAGAAGLEWAGVTADYDNSTLLLGDAVYRMKYQHIGPVWYQLLSEEQLGQAGGPPPGAVRLPGGRFELTVGEPGDWLPDSPSRAAAEQRVRGLVASA
jgi:hypothetical protein